MVSIIGMVIGILIFIAGIYYLMKEKADRESRKIYTIAAIFGVVIAGVSLIMMLL